jgi:hypothetical protein
MWTCRMCLTATQLGDMAVSFGPDSCLCLRCFTRQTGANAGMLRRICAGHGSPVTASVA